MKESKKKGENMSGPVTESGAGQVPDSETGAGQASQTDQPGSLQPGSVDSETQGASGEQEINITAARGKLAELANQDGLSQEQLDFLKHLSELNDKQLAYYLKNRLVMEQLEAADKNWLQNQARAQIEDLQEQELVDPQRAAEISQEISQAIEDDQITTQTQVSEVAAGIALGLFNEIEQAIKSIDLFKFIIQAMAGK